MSILTLNVLAVNRRLPPQYRVKKCVLHSISCQNVYFAPYIASYALRVFLGRCSRTSGGPSSRTCSARSRSLAVTARLRELIGSSHAESFRWPVSGVWAVIQVDDSTHFSPHLLEDFAPPCRDSDILRGVKKCLLRSGVKSCPQPIHMPASYLQDFRLIVSIPHVA